MVSLNGQETVVVSRTLTRQLRKCVVVPSVCQWPLADVAMLGYPSSVETCDTDSGLKVLVFYEIAVSSSVDFYKLWGPVRPSAWNNELRARWTIPSQIQNRMSSYLGITIHIE
ncbi:hypothetical protein V1477_004972 [Vespula maculifrons]|uniref:Uncharacterized protein n=2 Tax=Vespula TaxID=7451 RepID=A0A834NF18_VESVU|nr:hypothetical protein HZH66_002237 [Vespula vulgaris]